MDNTNDLSSSIKNTSDSFYNTATNSADHMINEASSAITTTTSSNWFDKIKNMSTPVKIIISIVLVFLIFNAITYFSSGIQNITNDSNSIVKKILGLFAIVTGKTVDVTAQGAKDVIGGTANVIDTGLTDVQNVVTPKAKTSSSTLNSQPVENTQSTKNTTEQNSFNKILNSAQPQTSQDYEASEATSTVNTTGKAGWCYVGEDRGFRTCAQVGVNDKCMSGDIFPTNDLCINPNLRS
jgi:uncharacterized membrane protein